MCISHICLISNGIFASQTTHKILLDLNKETTFIVALCLISNDIFASQTTHKILLDLNKETIFIVALEMMYMIWGKIVNG